MTLVGNKRIARRDFLRALVGIGLGLAGVATTVCRGAGQKATPKEEETIPLPPPKWDGEMSVEKAIKGRRSEMNRHSSYS